MPYAVSIGVEVERQHAETDIEELLDRVLDELDALGVEADYAGSLASDQYEFALLLDAASIEDAHERGMTALRAAVHAAGAGTPNWPAFARRSLGAERIDQAHGADLIDA